MLVFLARHCPQGSINSPDSVPTIRSHPINHVFFLCFLVIPANIELFHHRPLCHKLPPSGYLRHYMSCRSVILHFLQQPVRGTCSYIYHWSGPLWSFGWLTIPRGRIRVLFTRPYKLSFTDLLKLLSGRSSALNRHRQFTLVEQKCSRIQKQFSACSILDSIPSNCDLPDKY